ncbi:MAG: M20/M25/M40 family metallo-hydrolase [Segetibacter sp.]
MKKSCISFFCIVIALYTHGQSIDEIINRAEVKRIESVLSADSMQGRKAFTASADKAADFISNEFKKIGLSTFNGLKTYKQTFSLASPSLTNATATIDGTVLSTKQIIPLTTAKNVQITEASGFSKAYIKQGEDFRKKVNEHLKRDQNLVVFIDSSFASVFARLVNLRQYLTPSDKTVVFVLGNYPATRYNISFTQELNEMVGENVVGIIPGRNKKEEMVIFSGHYDHIGTQKGGSVDTIYNGANDDASGITAIIETAKYYKAAKNNRRTLVFVAFTAEEIGGFGSQYFSKQLDADKVVAMLNIEMIGTESKWGKNSAYITGFEKSDLGKVLQHNLKGSRFAFYPDPYIDQNLFYRSDNATLARLGVPAHTISTSKMDNEQNYHKLTDELSTLDIPNMTEIIKSVVLSAGSIVEGKETPSRVKSDELKR